MASTEADMEARIARLESDVGHMRSDLSEVKTDVRTLRDRMELLGITLSDKLDARIGTVVDKIDAVDDKIDGRIGTVADKIDARFDALTLKIEDLKDSLNAAKLWALILYAALAAGVFSTMARSFGWI